MKLTKHAYLLWTISLIILLALALLIPFVHTPVYWLALGCTVAMFGVCAFTFARAFRRDQTLESKLLGWPIFKVGCLATLVQTAVGFVFMALAARCPFWLAILLEILLFAAVAFCLTVKDASREAVTRFEANVTDSTGAWKAIRARANALAAERAELRKLAEEIRFADPMPTSLDGEISDQLELLSDDASEANIKRAFALLQRRKSLSKESK